MRSIISVSSAMARQQRPWSTTSSSGRRLCLLPTIATTNGSKQAVSWRVNTIVRTLVVGQPTKIQYMPIQTIDVRGVLVVIVCVCLYVLFGDFNTIISTRVCQT